MLAALPVSWPFRYSDPTHQPSPLESAGWGHNKNRQCDRRKSPPNRICLSGSLGHSFRSDPLCRWFKSRLVLTDKHTVHSSDDPCCPLQLSFPLHNPMVTSTYCTESIAVSSTCGAELVQSVKKALSFLWWNNSLTKFCTPHSQCITVSSTMFTAQVELTNSTCSRTSNTTLLICI